MAEGGYVRYDGKSVTSCPPSNEFLRETRNHSFGSAVQGRRSWFNEWRDNADPD